MVFVTPGGALAGTRNSSMGPPLGINPLTRHSMSIQTYLSVMNIITNSKETFSDTK